MLAQIARDLASDPERSVRRCAIGWALSGGAQRQVDFGLCSTTIYPDRRYASPSPPVSRHWRQCDRPQRRRDQAYQELNDPKFTYAILNVPPAIARAKLVLPQVKQLLLDSPSALFLAIKTGRAQAFAIDKPIADFYEGENPDLVRLDVSGTPFDFVFQDAIFLKPGDFKWWLFLDTWVGELRSGSRYEKYIEWYRKWLKRDPPPQRFYDYNKY
jgi:polar amino acid transport system substrate-binding protein